MKGGQMANYKPTIGMEVHVELSTISKMFCGCPADHFGKKPNTQTCPVCLGLPGALPVPNKKAIDWTIMIGLALGGKINPTSKFDRKHYFYPDLPKGYQISQYDEPISIGGYINTTNGKVRITRVHIEEDTGKLLHKEIDGKKKTLVDFNRSGVALVEIVTEPDIKTPQQAKEFGQTLREIIRHLGVSNADMEKGSMRLEVNISWGLNLGYKVEIKNLNSFKFVKKAVQYELARQKGLLDNGKTPIQETRGWSETENKTTSQRTKETAQDYRYFPEPDIPPLVFSKNLVEELKKNLPDPPEVKMQKLVKKHGLPENYAEVLIKEPERVQFFEKAAILTKKHKIPIKFLADAMINLKLDKKYGNPTSLVKKLVEITKKDYAKEKEVEEAVKTVLEEEKRAVSDFKSGNEKVIGFLIGKVQVVLRGKGQPKEVEKQLKKVLG